MFIQSTYVYPSTSGVSIIADVAESIAETQPISINRIEIWDRLIGKHSKRTSLQRRNCYWREYNICKDGGALWASQATRPRITSEKYFLTPALNRSRRYGNTSEFTLRQFLCRWNKTSTCQEPFANSAGERTPYQLYALSSLVRSLGKRFSRCETYTNNKEKKEEIWLSPARKKLYTNV